MHKRWFAFTSSLALVSGACLAGNEHGNLAAPDTGDVSNPPAPRVADATAELQAQCGTGDITEAGALTVKRVPYLQQVTTGGARILWTTTTRGEARVRLTTPDDVEVVSVEAAIDEDAHPAGAVQREAVLTDLEPDTVYCYEIEEDGALAFDRAGFKTAPEAGGTARFLVFGDSGDHAGPDQMALLEQMGTVPADFILHVGDIAYDDGSLAQFEESFFAPYAPLLKFLPSWPVSGNHEYGTSDARPYREVFDLPNNERWFSFDWGDVHFVGLDTERMNDEQVAWLEQDLAATAQPWTVAYMHKPMYSSGEHGSEMGIRGRLAPIFERHGVQLVLAGHDHNYERVEPQNGVAYVVTGGGGRGTRGVGTSDFTAFSVEVIHFLYIEVSGDTLSLHAIDAEGREFDQLVLHR